MNDSYMELLIKHKQSSKEKTPGIVAIVLCVIAVIAALFINLWIMLIAIGCGVAAYMLFFKKLNVEYEYLFVDKQLTVDRICNESSRKTVATYQLTDMEMMAPTKSYHLDDYRNRQCKEVDYSAGCEPEEGLVNYEMYLSGNQRVKLTLSEDFAKALRTHFPQKFFSE